MQNNYQDIFINLDDSGKLSSKEKICVYAGVVFLSKAEKDRFITQYRSIINSIKCNYCNADCGSCASKCPEIKNINIKPKDKRRIMQYINKYLAISLIINNEEVYDYILSNKASKGRYVDYTLRRLIKETVKMLINTNKINPYQPVRLIINIDQQTTKSNGYYALKEGLVEELKYGIHNFNYQNSFDPVLFSELDILLSYQNSEKSYVIQAADLLAGTVRRMSIDSFFPNNKKIEDVIDLKIFFP